jgi:hypothetical protein
MQCIESTSEDTKEQLLTQVKCNPEYALHITESTDVAGFAQLQVSPDTLLKKTSRKSSHSVYHFQTDLQGVSNSRQ